MLLTVTVNKAKKLQQMHSIKYNNVPIIKHNSWPVSNSTCLGTGVSSSRSLLTQRTTSPTTRQSRLWSPSLVPLKYYNFRIRKLHLLNFIMLWYDNYVIVRHLKYNLAARNRLYSVRRGYKNTRLSLCNPKGTLHVNVLSLLIVNNWV